MATQCGDILSKEAIEQLREAEEGDEKREQELRDRLWEEYAKEAPAIREILEDSEKKSNEMWKEIEAEFPKIDEHLKTVEEKSVVAIASGEKWDLNRFEKDGFGPYEKQPPDFEKLFPRVKIKEVPEVKFGEQGQQILAETDRATGTNTKLYEPRSEKEIKDKEAQILSQISPPKITPEEAAILGELKITRDAEKMQRDLIKEQSKIHDYGHHIISPEMRGKVLSPAQIDRWQTIFEECNKSGKFVTQYASADWEEFFCENLRVFFTHPDWVTEQHPMAYREIEKIVAFLKTREYLGITDR